MYQRKECANRASDSPLVGGMQAGLGVGVLGGQQDQERRERIERPHRRRCGLLIGRGRDRDRESTGAILEYTGAARRGGAEQRASADRRSTHVGRCPRTRPRPRRSGTHRSAFGNRHRSTPRRSTADRGATPRRAAPAGRPDFSSRGPARPVAVAFAVASVRSFRRVAYYSSSLASRPRP